MQFRGFYTIVTSFFYFRIRKQLLRNLDQKCFPLCRDMIPRLQCFLSCWGFFMIAGVQYYNATYNFLENINLSHHRDVENCLRIVENVLQKFQGMKSTMSHMCMEYCRYATNFPYLLY